MKRIEEKVKDLIEVRDYTNLKDFLAEPSETLSSYFYTSETSELMGKWFDELVSVNKEAGKAKALAGYRGVGKSHFLAAFGAILANPDLRSKVTDSHVSSSIHHLKRRHYPVVYVQRGTAETLLEELKSAIAKELEIDIEQIDDNLENLFSFVSEQTGELPLVIIVDTSLKRADRVSRDDGVFLGEMAEIAKSYNIFIGVALDDDITGADGINSAIARSYTIDYLNQEHLYQIVDAEVFPKHQQSQALIRDVHQYFQGTLPAFRWSEQRFTSLYPLHPAILEVAPFVRFYASDFALLGFASEAGARILGRPANSLISLDEVFDNVENNLRKSKDLKEAFEVYDKIVSEVISAIPVMERLQAKLILKALFILSLDGDGTTASEISATMLIYREADVQESIDSIEQLLETFVSYFPEDIWRTEKVGKETSFSLKVGRKDDLNGILEESVKEVSEEFVPQVLRRIARDKFEDWDLFSEKPDEQKNSMECELLWRGSFRQSRLFWNWNNEILWNSDNEFDNPAIGQENAGKFLDLELFINNAQSESETQFPGNPFSLQAVWQPAALNKEEIETIKRLHVLLSDESLKGEFGEQVRAAGHALMVAAEEIWNRIFLKDAKILFEGQEYDFPKGAELDKSLSELLSTAFEVVFDSFYPSHPVFAKPLRMDDVSSIVQNLFGSVRSDDSEVKTLAEDFALPLGLVSSKGEHYSLESEENLLEVPLVKKVLDLLEENGNETLSLESIYVSLGEKPFGLVKEAQSLILAALVAQRKVEFVTSKGNRINHRSLDLKIIWEDIDGIAEPLEVSYDSENLVKWAEALTGKEINSESDKKVQIKESLSKWLEDWNSVGVLKSFNELPDEILNTKIWKISVRVEKTFGKTAETLKWVFDEMISLEDGLQRIAETFLDSVEELESSQKDLKTLKEFIEGTGKREKIWKYLAVCEFTQDANIEKNKEALLKLIDESYDFPSPEKNAQMLKVWDKFQADYSLYFSLRHNKVMASGKLKAEFDEILKSDEWWEFENLSKLTIFQNIHWKNAQRIIEKARELECKTDVKENLKLHPFCSCSFNLTQLNDWKNLPKDFASIILEGRKSYRKTLWMMKDLLTKLLTDFVDQDKNKEFKKTAKELMESLSSQKDDKVFSSQQIMMLRAVLSATLTKALINIELPKEKGLQTSTELREKLNVWVNDLPNESLMLKF